MQLADEPQTHVLQHPKACNSAHAYAVASSEHTPDDGASHSGFVVADSGGSVFCAGLPQRCAAPMQQRSTQLRTAQSSTCTPREPRGRAPAAASRPSSR
eukprot:354395-Chlamydomonas_euryale.AAC.2